MRNFRRGQSGAYACRGACISRKRRRRNRPALQADGRVKGDRDGSIFDGRGRSEHGVFGRQRDYSIEYPHVPVIARETMPIQALSLAGLKNVRQVPDADGVVIASHPPAVSCQPPRNPSTSGNIGSGRFPHDGKAQRCFPRHVGHPVQCGSFSAASCWINRMAPPSVNLRRPPLNFQHPASTPAISLPGSIHEPRPQIKAFDQAEAQNFTASIRYMQAAGTSGE
jgi:hypothetical protein